MRNLWKGFVLGSLTGAAVGAALGWERDPAAVHDAHRSAGPARRFSPNAAWKGFVVGALTGSGVGLTVDIGTRSGQGLASAAMQAKHAVTEHGAELATQVSESDTARAFGDAARQTVHQAAETARMAGSNAKGLATDVVQAAEHALPEN